MKLTEYLTFSQGRRGDTKPTYSKWQLMEELEWDGRAQLLSHPWARKPQSAQ